MIKGFWQTIALPDEIHSERIATLEQQIYKKAVKYKSMNT
jgi:hypothetical protein